MLGLLALRPWTTYELAKQMQRSVRWFWPRAERKLYEEPKRLAVLGLATVETTATGRRPSSVYQITTAGRHALRDWLRAGPGAPMQVEMEAMIRVFFADGASPDDLRATLIAVSDQAVETLVELSRLAEGTLAGADDFPERRATNAVALELWVRLHETVRDWSTWAQEEVESWPPQHRGRREVAAGSAERGGELFAEILQRIGTDASS
jgi:DNA-binding PadR family transcriptional regulator